VGAPGPLVGFVGDDVVAGDSGAAVVGVVALFGGVVHPVKNRPQATANEAAAVFDVPDIATAMCDPSPDRSLVGAR
jgi:hypothetical protein